MERFTRHFVVIPLLVVLLLSSPSVNGEAAAPAEGFLSKIASNFSDAFKSKAPVDAADQGDMKSIQSMQDIKPVSAAVSAPVSIATAQSEPAVGSAPVSAYSAPVAAAASSSPPSNVASLPPMPVVSNSKSAIPDVLLPSKMLVVTHQPVVAETNPRKRGQCHEILSHVEKSGMYKVRNTPAFGAFVNLIDLVSEERAIASRRDHIDDDKNSNIALTVISQSYGAASLPWDYIVSLRNCAVDAKGRTIYMRLVELGYLKALTAPSSDQLNTIPLHELRDSENNGIYHLAVMSKSLEVVEHVVRKVGADYALKALDQRNLDGKRPVDLAVDYGLADITSKLKNHYSLVSALAKLNSRMKYQAPAVVQLGQKLNAASASA